MKIKLDSRIDALITNSVQNNHRALFVVVGDGPVQTLTYLLQKHKQTRILWMYSIKNKDKKEKKEKREKGTRYCLYRDSDKILGKSYEVLVLQDYDFITPNLLAKTVETVVGGGIIILVLNTMQSLAQLHGVSTGQTNDSKLFHHRFLSSLGQVDACLVVDDQFNVLPISAGKHISRTPKPEADKTLVQLQRDLADTQPVGSLLGLSKTVDQAKAVLSFVDIIQEKTLSQTVMLTAGRGRGKSAALGLSVAAAVSYGYSNIFITSPFPENLGTLFEFVFKGFDALGYQEHMDYDILQSKAYNNAIVRVNIFRDHRQTIQWIVPQDFHVLAQCELLVIDEAAAIPLPVVEKLIGSYLVLMASTINGYEGTGRALELKLLKKLRNSTGRTFKEMKLEEPIRYGVNDGIEQWLYNLLCLNPVVSPTRGFPHPSQCKLFHVDRRSLFSGHPVAEQFLGRIMSVLVAGHYRNSPDDLMMISDHPSVHLFVLLDPQGTNTLPWPIVVLQVVVEGKLDGVIRQLDSGVRGEGDLIPWVVSQQFRDDNFGALVGARVVRLAVDGDFIGMGYGSQAMKLLAEYYNGAISLAENESSPEPVNLSDAKSLPPLLKPLSEVSPIQLDWLGVAFGLTPELGRFWKRAGYQPVYIRQTHNELTGENSCVMLKEIRNKGWLQSFATDFARRFTQLLAYDFSKYSIQMVLNVFQAAAGESNVNNNSESNQTNEEKKLITHRELNVFFDGFDLKRLSAYTDNLLDYHVILDLIPTVAKLFTSGRLGVALSTVQQAMLIGIGLQKKSVEAMATELELTVQQALAIFGKSIKRVSNMLEAILEKEEAAAMEPEMVRGVKKDVNDENQWKPTSKSLEATLEEAEKSAAFKAAQKELIDSLPLEQYAVGGTDEDWSKIKGNKRGVVAVANPSSSKKSKVEKHSGVADELVKAQRGEMNDPSDVLKKIKAKKLRARQRLKAKKNKE